MSDVTRLSQKSFRSQIAKLDFVHEQRVKLYAELVQTGHLIPDLCRLISMYVGVVFQIYRRKLLDGCIQWECSTHIMGNPAPAEVYLIPLVFGVSDIPKALYLINGGDCYYNYLHHAAGNIHRQITDVRINHISFGNGMELISWNYANRLINTSFNYVLMQNGKQVPLVILLQIPDELTNEITKYYNSYKMVRTQTSLTTIYVLLHPSFNVLNLAAKFNIGIVTYEKFERFESENDEVLVQYVIAIQLPDTPTPSVTVQTTRVV